MTREDLEPSPPSLTAGVKVFVYSSGHNKLCDNLLCPALPLPDNGTSGTAGPS